MLAVALPLAAVSDGGCERCLVTVTTLPYDRPLRHCPKAPRAATVSLTGSETCPVPLGQYLKDRALLLLPPVCLFNSEVLQKIAFEIGF